MASSGFSPGNKMFLYDLDPAAAESEKCADVVVLGGGASLIKVHDPSADGSVARTDGVINWL
jgi:hypothetical protein